MECRDLTKQRIEYITGNESLAALAKRSGVPYKVVSETCAREKWVAQRKAHRETLVQKTVDRVATKKAKQIDKELKRVEKATGMLSGHLLDVLQRPDAFMRRDMAGDTYYDARAMSDAARAIKDTILSIRNIYGLPTVQERESMLNATRRLELEQRKAAASLGEQQEGGGVVEIAPVVEGEA